MSLDKEKLALVTGAAGVLGSATARTLAAGGYRVILVDLHRQPLADLAGDIGPSAFPVPLDISRPEAVAEACSAMRNNHGEVSVLVNNAGVLSNAKAAETSTQEWRRIFSVNLDGAFYLSRQWLPEMQTRGWGRIVNICSLAMKPPRERWAH